jgi:uncharacterized Zn finger protein
MARHYGGWAPYVSVAKRRQQAAREMEKRRKAGQPVSPVEISGRRIAATFWGKAWCDHLEGYSDYANRLPRGKTYVRNGSVVDLQIKPREISAWVSGSTLYQVQVRIAAVPARQWQQICADCAGGIDSLVELLQGHLSQGIMERLCRQDHGLFPKPADIVFSCSCPDFAYLCKHVAAVLYGVGARLDTQPDLLFLLREVNQLDLLAHLDRGIPLASQDSAPSRAPHLDEDELASLFGIDLDTSEGGAAPGSAAPQGKGHRASQPVTIANSRTGASSSAGRAARRPPTASAIPRPPPAATAKQAVVTPPARGRAEMDAKTVTRYAVTPAVQGSPQSAPRSVARIGKGGADTVPPRPRGRPPKAGGVAAPQKAPAATPVAAKAGRASTARSRSMSPTTPAPAVAAPRRRGRPPKAVGIFVPQKTPAATPVVAKAGRASTARSRSMSPTTPAPAVAAPRRRGRPPKAGVVAVTLKAPAATPAAAKAGHAPITARKTKNAGIAAAALPSVRQPRGSRKG